MYLPPPSSPTVRNLRRGRLPQLDAPVPGRRHEKRHVAEAGDGPDERERRHTVPVLTGNGEERPPRVCRLPVRLLAHHRHVALRRRRVPERHAPVLRSRDGVAAVQRVRVPAANHAVGAAREEPRRVAAAAQRADAVLPPVARPGNTLCDALVLAVRLAAAERRRPRHRLRGGRTVGGHLLQRLERPALHLARCREHYGVGPVQGQLVHGFVQLPRVDGHAEAQVPEGDVAGHGGADHPALAPVLVAHDDARHRAVLTRCLHAEGLLLHAAVDAADVAAVRAGDDHIAARHALQAADGTGVSACQAQPVQHHARLQAEDREGARSRSARGSVARRSQHRHGEHGRRLPVLRRCVAVSGGRHERRLLVQKPHVPETHVRVDRRRQKDGQRVVHGNVGHSARVLLGLCHQILRRPRMSQNRMVRRRRPENTTTAATPAPAAAAPAGTRSSGPAARVA
eukprot:Rhum_TRINITY_DN14847_c4_g1::Rhum_TRINITY_DN14847_c4_g1_i1::g.125692::m.125692